MKTPLPWLLLPMLLARCSQSVEGQRCIPGATSVCACISGATGAQTCDDDGASFAQCICAVERDAVTLDVAGDAAGDAEGSPADANLGDADVSDDETGDSEPVDDLGTASDVDIADSGAAPAVGDEAIRVELLWHTPGDINENDTGGDQIYFSVGSDMDLHFLHPKAYGNYFDYLYDCYWENVEPEWGMFAATDNPSLDRDDSDGAGPEVLTMSMSEPNVRYQVGVHYWNDWGYGPSIATVRIYIDGVLRDQWEGVEMVNDDMWDTHYIDWPSGTVTRIDAQPRITHTYRGAGFTP